MNSINMKINLCEHFEWIKLYRFPITRSNDETYYECIEHWLAKYIGDLENCQYVPSSVIDMIKQYTCGIFRRLCSEFSVNAYPHGKTVHILRSSEPEAEAEPPPMAARSVLDRLA